MGENSSAAPAVIPVCKGQLPLCLPGRPLKKMRYTARYLIPETTNLGGLHAESRFEKIVGTRPVFQRFDPQAGPAASFSSLTPARWPRRLVPALPTSSAIS